MKGAPREPLAFAAVALAAGVLTWLDLSGRYEAQRVPTAKRLEAPAVERPPEVRLGAPSDAPPRTREESLFTPPRELLPLDPLVLPDPPRPPLSVRRPAVRPALLGGLSPAYRVSPEDLGRLVLGDDAVPSGDEAGEDAAQAPPEAAQAGSAVKPSLKPAGKLPAADEHVLEARHDWLVRAGRPRVWGRILNADPLGLAARPGEDLRFQQVSEATGGPLGAPFAVPRAEVEEFGLARTLANEYHARSRALGSGPAGAVGRRALALEMLERSATEPEALAHALAEVDLLLAAAPADPAAWRLAAAVRRAAQDLLGELEACVAAERAGVEDPALLATHARLARTLGLRERAAELVERAELAGRPVSEVPVARALLLRDEARWSEALAALRQAESLAFAGPREELQQRELRLLLGETQVALGELDAAAREAGRVLLDDPQDVRALRLQGAVAAARGQLDEATAAFAAALAAAPGDAAALEGAGLLAWAAGDGDGARRLLQAAVEADPVRAVGPTLALGFLHEDAGREEQARDLYAGALVLEPGHPEALYRLGRRQRQDGDPTAATVTLRQALALGGPETLLLLELSRAALESEAFEDAQRYAREAERLEPGNPEVQWSLGLALLAAGDVRGCVAPLERAVQAGARGAHAALAVALYRQGQAQAALDHLGEVAKAYAGRPADAQALFAAAQETAIRENLARRQWLDRFGRSTLQRGWSEHVWDGSPRVFLDAGAVRIAGRMERPREDELPGITRAVDGRGFFGCAAELAAGAPGETRAGLSLTYSQVKGSQGKLPKARLSIWLDVDGQVRLSVLDNFDTLVLQGEPAGASVAPGAAVLLGIERLDDVAGRFAFSVDGRRVGPEVECKSLRSFRNPFELAAWADAAPGRQVDATLSLVRVVQAP